ncbi:MAG: hypothetical protein WAP35_01765 [Solirubrobacterales bacterium]
MPTADGRYWSDAEALPPAQSRATQDEALREQVEYLWARSEFYREKLAAAGLAAGDIAGVDDLARVPFTEKHELRDSLQASPPLGRHLAAPPQDVIQIQASSGTTGSPSYVGLTQNDIDVWCELGARTFYASGARPGDRALHAFGMSKGFVGGLPIVQILQSMGICDLPIGAESGVERLLRVQADQRANLICGTPFFLGYLGDCSSDVVGRAADELGVTRLIVGGEPGGGVPAVRQRLEDTWGAPVREMLGGTDLGCTYWGECDAADGMHFLSPDLMVAELIDHESGDRIEPTEGVTGELVYTALRRQASPLLRFRTRDHVVVTGTSCACGRSGYKIRCVGRTDDMLIVRGINVFPSAVKDLVMGLRPRATGEMRIRPDFEGHATQKPLPVAIEHSRELDEPGRRQLAVDAEAQMRGALNIKAVVTLVAEGTLERPGLQKVALIEREVSQ